MEGSKEKQPESVEEAFLRVFGEEGPKMIKHFQDVFDHKDDYTIPEGSNVSGRDTFKMVCKDNIIVSPVTKEGFLDMIVSHQERINYKNKDYKYKKKILLDDEENSL